MKSGLRDRNNKWEEALRDAEPGVSMESGLGDRNNLRECQNSMGTKSCLNEVRSWRPEQ